jgi:hypothetical protein
MFMAMLTIWSIPAMEDSWVFSPSMDCQPFFEGQYSCKGSSKIADLFGFEIVYGQLEVFYCLFYLNRWFFDTLA